jgi:hypothetical protein
MLARRGSLLPFVVLTLLATAHASGGARAAAMSAEDRVRLAEAFRLGHAVQDVVWPGWSERPFDVLLVAGDCEYLVHSSQRPEGFTPQGRDPSLGGPVLVRRRVTPPNLLATFPAFGATPTIVIGTAPATAQASSEWVITLLHEHFHQLQYSEPGYFQEAEGLGLTGGDTTGTWMLSYPFPYESPSIGTAFSSLSSELARLLETPATAGRLDARGFWQRYGVFREQLKPADYRYLSFQLYQEGVARYVELKAAEAASGSYQASPAFLQLPDYRPYATVAAKIRAGILGSLRSSLLREKKREAFYAFGAGLAILLDRAGVDWKARYLREKFHLEAYAGPSPVAPVDDCVDADDLSREASVLAAAVRQQIDEHLDASARARGTVLCVGVNPGGAPQSPSRAFMAGLAGESALRRLGECDPRPEGAVESMTLRPAVIVTVGPIDWRADDEAWVTVAYFRTRSQSALRRYRVVREPSGWLSLGPILLDGPP